MFNLSALLPGHFCFQRPSDAMDPFIAITAIIMSVTAFLIAWRAHHRSYKSAEPNEELVRKFVESAPLDRLKDLQLANDDNVAQHQPNPEGSDDQKRP